MVEAYGGAGGVSFPVVFFDGECETGIGNVVIHQATDFKAFQSMLSRKIGISPHQFSVYIADSNNSHNRVPITGKVNFSFVTRKTDCIFVVVLKRSRRYRTRKGKNRESCPPASAAAAMKKEPPANVVLLRRGGGGVNNLRDARVLTGLDEFGKRVRDFQVEKERYSVNLGMANLRIERESKSYVCEQCDNAKIVDGGFHRCVYDAVTFGFRSYAGPIARPGRGPR